VKIDGKRHGGFTLIEVVIVIAILGVLAAIAIPRFITLDDEAHDAVARATHGGFASGVNILHAEWQARGSSSVTVSPTGWPIGAGTPPVNNADCVAVWTDVLTSPSPRNPGFVAGADGWGIFGAGNLCFFVYQPDNTPWRFIRYNVNTGLVEYITL